MCKYCDTLPNKFAWDEYKEGELICDTKYEACNIVQSKEGKYYIRLTGSYEDISDVISFCPFCGRNLKE